MIQFSKIPWKGNNPALNVSNESRIALFVGPPSDRGPFPRAGIGAQNAGDAFVVGSIAGF